MLALLSSYLQNFMIRISGNDGFNKTLIFIPQVGSILASYLVSVQKLRSCRRFIHVVILTA